MATSKSTVVGIRLDHDRRAWVEAEAARRGVSVRGLFEGMIDGARSAEAPVDTSDGLARSESARGSSGEPNTNGLDSEPGTADVPTTAGEDVGAPFSSVNTPSSPIGSSPWLDLGSVTALPGGVIRGAISLTTGIIKTSGRCAFHRLESCPVTKHWSGRSA
jgi:hypothetical protein